MYPEVQWSSVQLIWLLPSTHTRDTADVVQTVYSLTPLSSLQCAQTALHLAAGSGSAECARVVSAMLPPSEQTKLDAELGWPPLFYAVCSTRILPLCNWSFFNVFYFNFVSTLIFIDFQKVNCVRLILASHIFFMLVM